MFLSGTKNGKCIDFPIFSFLNSIAKQTLQSKQSKHAKMHYKNVPLQKLESYFDILYQNK